MGRRNRHTSAFGPWIVFVMATANVTAQDTTRPANSTRQTMLPPPPAPLGVPKPGPATDAPYAPLPILQGGVVLPLYPPGSPLLNTDRLREPEQYNMSETEPGRINSIVNIHNPSIEVHLVDRSLNTGAAVILVAGGGHRTLNVGSESADFVPFFYNYGVNTIILRNRLRRDGYNPQTDAVNDALQAIRMVRAYAKEWNIDPKKIGIMGFSAGAELTAGTAVLFQKFDEARCQRSARGNEFAARLRGHHLSRPLTVCPQSHSSPGSAQCPAGVCRLWRLGRPGSCCLGNGILWRDARYRCAEYRNAHLWQWPPPRRPLTRRQPHERRINGSQQHTVWKLAISLYRLVPRSRFSAKGRRGNQSRERPYYFPESTCYSNELG